MGFLSNGNYEIKPMLLFGICILYYSDKTLTRNMKTNVKDLFVWHLYGSLIPLHINYLWFVTGCSGYKNEIPAFSASRSQSKSLGPWEIILFDKVWTNVGNGYNPNTGKFTAPKSGLCQISGTVMSTPGKKLYVYLFKNDKKTVSLYCGLGYATGTVNIVFKLQKGETVYMKHHNETQTIFSNSSVYCVFSGFLISE
jgi:hypothetical protein